MIRVRSLCSLSTTFMRDCVLLKNAGAFHSSEMADVGRLAV